MDIFAVTSTAQASSLQSINTDPVAAALRRPVEQLVTQTESTRVRLSAFGQVQSAVADVQTAAKGLQDSKQLQTVDSARKAAEAFVKAYNAEGSTTAALSRRGDYRTSAGVLADDSRVRSTSSELQRTVRNNQSALQQAGFTRQNDGTLAIDAKAFDAAFAKDANAVRQSLGAVGSQAEAVTTRQLSASGTVGSAVSSLTSKVAGLEHSQASLQALFDQSQRVVQEQSSRFNVGPFATGVAAYKGIFSL